MNSSRFTTDSGEEVRVIGVAEWSSQYIVVEVDGVLTCRPAALVLAHTTPSLERDDMTTKTKDPNLTVDPELTVNDEVEPKTPEENAGAVKEATSRKPSEEKHEPKEKQPTTAEVAATWIVATLEKEGPMTKKQLNELALKGNPKRMNTKQIVAAKKIGSVCPANKSGAYIPEGLDAGRNGGIQFVFANEKEKTLRVK